MLIDASAPVGKGDLWVAALLKRIRAPKLLVLSKCDLVEPHVCEEQCEEARSLAPWDDIVMCSATTGQGVEEFESKLVNLMPCGPQWFPEEMDTDQPLEVIIAEFVREKILRTFRDEIPHAIGVQTEELDYVRKKDLYVMRVIIYTEHDSQKGMIIGKGGNALKRIGSEARIDLERLLGCRVYLDLSVKVRKNWRRDAREIRRFGYGEGA